MNPLRYNGTPRGLLNCNDGGCPHCNGNSSSFEIPYECVCLHAEENALLEAGRERIGKDAVLYCNTSDVHAYNAFQPILINIQLVVHVSDVLLKLSKQA